jgi:hypothetical protein
MVDVVGSGGGEARDLTGGQAAAPLTPSERDELERLRAEVSQMRAEVDEIRGGDVTRPIVVAPAPRRWPRTLGAIVLITIGALLAPVAVVATWARSEVSDTERYVATVAPLAEDPAIQRAAAEKITAEIFARVDVQGLTTEAIDALASVLPPAVADRIQGLSGVLATGARNVVEDQVSNLVSSEAFANAWAEANRAAHEQLVAALSGTGDVVTVEGNAVSVNLATFANAVKQRLVERGFTFAERIPEINAQFVILQSDELPRIQRAYDLLERIGLWLPVVAAALLLLGIAVANDRRLAVMGTGIGVALTMVLAGGALAVARGIYLDSVPTDILPAAAAVTIFDTIVAFLRQGLRALGLLAVVVALGAFLTGPSTAARAVRGVAAAAAALVARGLQRIGVPMHRVGRSVLPLRRGLVLGLTALALVAFVAPAYPTPTLVVQLTVALLVALFVLQVLTSITEPPPARPKTAPAVAAGAA